jgi:CheY-like chemotaxis protein
MHSSAGAATRGAALESTQVPAPVRVVLAEDDDEFRGLLSACLRRAGLEVVEARHGLELLGLVASGVLRSDGEALVELVISDVRLPGATGLQALTALRRSDWNTPVILISSFADPDLRLEASRLGAALLDKPFDIEQMMSLVQQHVGPA